MEHAWLKVKVAKKSVEAEDIVSLELVAEDGATLPGFSAGSHIDIELPNGMIRQYSLCNDPEETNRYLIGVLLDPATRGGSRSVHEDVKEGSVVRISEPRNHFQLNPAAKKSVLFAGGIGVTPILCMAERLGHSKAKFEMHYCSRSPARTAFVKRIQSSSFAKNVHFHYDDGDAAQKLDMQAVLKNADADTHIYVCGPKGFIDFVTSTAAKCGLSEDQIHFEYFAGAVVDSSNDGAFKVKIASSGRVIDVAADESITTALAAAGIEIPMSCEQGVCGTCVTRVLEGEPDHRDLYFTDAEKAKNDQFTPCCSRSKSPLLVLDL